MRSLESRHVQASLFEIFASGSRGLLGLGLGFRGLGFGARGGVV